MLLDLLERRFNLKLRVETEEIPVYALTIAKGGLKIKPIEVESVKYEELRKLRASWNLSRRSREEGPDPRELDKLATYSGLLGCSFRPQAVQTGPEELNRFLEAVRRGVQPPECALGSIIRANGPNQLITNGGSPISSLVDALRKVTSPMSPSLPPNSLSDTLNGLLVVDKTGLPDTNCLTAIPSAGTVCAPLFSFVMEYARDESFFTRTSLTPERMGLDMSLPKAPNVFNALEKLGLHLEKSKASREFIAIEHIERPLSN